MIRWDKPGATMVECDRCHCLMEAGHACGFCADLITYGSAFQVFGIDGRKHLPFQNTVKVGDDEGEK